MALKKPKQTEDDAELDVTAFLNLMIVLVPVLLLSMSFANVTVLELRLPELTGGNIESTTAQSKLELEVKPEGINVYFPESTLIKQIQAIQIDDTLTYDYATLSQVMQAVKNEHPDKKDIVIKLSKNTDYQNIVQIMDAVKSHHTVVVASLVELELFPEISLGDAS